jgi:hypothetical protein
MGVVADVQLYDAVLLVHVAAVVVAFGATFAYPFLQAVVERVSPRSVPAMFRAMHTAGRYLVSPGLLVVLAAGLFLTSDRWDFGDLFVTAGLAIMPLVLGVAFLDRHEVWLIELSERDVAAAGAGEVEQPTSREMSRIARSERIPLRPPRPRSAADRGGALEARGPGLLPAKTADRRAGLRQHQGHPPRRPLPAARVTRLQGRVEADRRHPQPLEALAGQAGRYTQARAIDRLNPGGRPVSMSKLD